MLTLREWGVFVKRSIPERMSSLGARGHVRRMTTTKNLHSASVARRSTQLHALARCSKRLHQLHALNYARREGVSFASAQAGRCRGLNHWLIEEHLRGRRFVGANAAAGTPGTLDIDAHRRAGEYELNTRCRSALGSFGDGYVWVPLARTGYAR